MIFKNCIEYIGKDFHSDLMQIIRFFGKYLFLLRINFLYFFDRINELYNMCIPIIAKVQFPFEKSYKDDILIKKFNSF